MALITTAENAQIIWLSNKKVPEGKLVKGQGVLYVTSFGKVGQSTTNSNIGRTPIQVFVNRYSSRSNLDKNIEANMLIVFDTENENIQYDDLVRKTISKLYHKGLIPFSASHKGNDTVNGLNSEVLIDFSFDEHAEILIDCVKQSLGIMDRFITKKPFIARSFQIPVIEDAGKILKERKVCLLAAYTGFGKTLTTLQIISDRFPNGGIVLFTTPIKDTIKDIQCGIENYSFGSRDVPMVFMDIVDFNKTTISDLKVRSSNKEIIIICATVQAIRYGNVDGNIRDEFKPLSGNLDLWVQDERHFQYEANKTKGRLSEIEADAYLDLTATPYNVMEHYDKEEVLVKPLNYALNNRNATGIPSIKISSLDTAFHKVFPEYSQVFTKSEGFDPKKMFAYDKETKNFINLDDIKHLFEKTYYTPLPKSKNIFSISNDTSLSNVSKKCGLWVLPEGNAPEYIPLLARILNADTNEDKRDIFYISSYELEELADRSDETTSDYVEKILKDYSRVIILTCKKLITGSNIPCLGHIVLGVSLSATQLEQLLGRFIRPYPDKDAVKLYNYVSSLSLHQTIGNMSVELGYLEGNGEKSLAANIPILAYDINEDREIEVSVDTILKYGQTFYSNLSRKNTFPVAVLINFIKKLPDEVKKSFLKQKTGNVSEIKEIIQIGNGSKIYLPSTTKKSSIKSLNIDKETEEICSLIQNITVESVWLAFVTKTYGYENILSMPELKSIFTSHNMELVLDLANNHETFRNLLINFYKEKETAFRYANLKEIVESIFSNTPLKQQQGTVYVPFQLATTLINEIPEDFIPQNILVYNALSGTIPLTLKDKFPNARIICVEPNNIYIDHLRNAEFETISYYDFINPRSEFNKMETIKFDVVIGNPPYQKENASSSANPIYQKFVEQAINLKPKYIIMVIPARFLTGGKFLDSFREKFINDKRVRKLVDYHDSKQFFPSVQIEGGVCYFRWERDNLGECEIIEHYKNGHSSTMTRFLVENGDNISIRYNDSIQIINKVKLFGEDVISNKVLGSSPFGLNTNFKEYQTEEFDNSIKLYMNNNRCVFVDKDLITKNKNLIGEHKVLLTAANGGDTINPIYAEPESCCTQTYLIMGIFDTKQEALNFITYMKTDFFLFLLKMRKYTQHRNRKTYAFIPTQSYNKSWTDQELYSKYNFSLDDIAFIESVVK